MSSYGFTVYAANAWLNTMRGGGNGVTLTAPTNMYAQLHIGAPGASGTTNLCAGTVGGTVRVAVTLAAASAGGIVITGTLPQWTCSAASVSETLTGLSIWDASSGGNCWYTGALTASKAWSTNDTFQLGTDSITFAPLAA